MRCLMLLLLTLSFTVCAFAQLGPGMGQGELKGVLLKPGGMPAAKAQIIVRRFTGGGFLPGSDPHLSQEAIVTTDDQGKFVLGVPPDQGASFRSYTSYALILVPGCCATVLPLNDCSGTVQLLPEKTMDVTITFPDGTPAPGAILMLNSIIDIFIFNSPLIGVSTPALTFRAGNNGVARIPIINTQKSTRIPTTELVAFAVAGRRVKGANGETVLASYSAYPCRFGITENPRPATIALVDAVTLIGKVTSPDGKPLQGATVSHAKVPALPARTDANGQYILAGIPRSRTEQPEPLFITHPDYARARVLAPTSGNIPTVVLRPLVTIKGRVVDAASGAPIAGTFSIRASYSLGAENIPANLDALYFDTAADGTFTIHIPPESCILAFGRGFDGTKYRVEKQFTNGETVDLKVEKGAGPRR